MRRKIFSILIAVCLLFQQLGFASIATELNLAGHLNKISSAFTPDRFRPMHIRFFSFDALNDNIKVMLDKGDVKNLKESQINATTEELLNYFLVGVSLPNDKFWVNLRPDSESNIIDNFLAKTDVGKVMLEADLQLKKDTALFTSPETSEGKLYWNKLYQKAAELYGYQEVNIPTLTRPWIVPNEIIVRESKDSAYIYKATLKVMLEQDILKDSSIYNFKDERAKALNEYSSQLIREIIIPKLTQEINLSKRYAPLRQVYYSIILSRWFKSRFSNQTGQYASRIDRSDLTGLVSASAWSKTTYFNAYKKSFSQGEYNIKETVRTPTGQVIRSYFSGGMDFAVMPISGAKTSSAIETSLITAGLVTPEMLKSTSSPVSIEVRRIGDLKNTAENQGIDSGILVTDWNVTRKALADDKKLARIFDSTDAIDEAFNKLGLQYLYLITHAERPQEEKDPQVRFEKFSLVPIAEKAKDVLAKKGLNNVELVMLPFDLDEATKVIQEHKAKANGKKIMFVLENIRLYTQEQLAADKSASLAQKAEVVKTRKAFEEKLISLTGKSTDNLVYISEAFDKAHRGEEASMEMAWLFPEANRAAGPKFAKDIQSVLNFQLRITKSLSAMFGGAKFDKYDAFGKLAETIAKSKGKLMIVGAQLNAYLKAQNMEVGKSILPNAADQKKVDKGLEAMKKSGVEILLPEDLVVDGKADPVALNALTTEDVQIDIGDKAIEQDVNYIDSLKKGDGLILNGGAGVFDKATGSKKGTIALVVAANNAAKRGVAVIAAGGDMYNAVQMVVKEVQGFELDPTFEISTGGGSLLTSLAKGIANLPTVRAVLQMDPTQGLHDIYSSVKAALPEGIVLNTVTTLAEDSSINGDEANRKALLDPFRSIAGTMNITIPDGPLEVKANLIYDGMFMPVVVLADNLPDALKEKVTTAKDSAAVSDVIVEYLKPFFAASDVNMSTVTKDKLRSSKLDPSKLGPASVDVSALKGTKSEKGDLLFYVPVWVKRSVAAMDALNEKITLDLKAQAPSIAALLEKTRAPLSWPKEMPVIANSEVALQTFAQYTPLFFDEFSNGDLTHIALLRQIVSNLDPQTFVNPEGITIDELMGDFVSTKDKDSKIPGIGKNLLAFKSRINTLQQLSFFLHILANPQINTTTGKIIPVKDRVLQNEIVGFYARTYRYLLGIAQNYFKNTQEFEPLRDEIGSNAQRLNKAIRESDALEISKATAKQVIDHLTAKGVELSQAEKDNIGRVFAYYENKAFAYDILELAGMLRESTFVASFRHLALDHPKQVLPSEKPFEAIDGTGQIGSVAIVLRSVEDINTKESGYVSEYKFRTTKLKGDTAEDKFKSAVKVATESFGDPIIKSAGVKVMTNSGLITVNDLLLSGRLEFKAANQVIESRLDFQDPIYVKSVYPVSIILDGNEVGVINFLDVTQFEAGYKEAALNKSLPVLVNIPRPMIIRKANGKEIYFSMVIDATPGGVNIGNRFLTEAAEQGKPKLDGPPLYKFIGKYDLANETTAVEGDAAVELIRLKEILQQTEATRLPKGGDESFIYVKAQIPSKLILPDALGGSINFMGKYMHKIAHVKESGAQFVSTTSCSTNGESYITLALSAFVGKFGLNMITKAGPTYHMYTSGDKKKGLFGDLNEKTTGAAKGVREHMLLDAIYGAMRTPTAYTNGETDLKGGSLFYLSVLLPQNVQESLVRKYVARVAAEYPEMLKLFTEADKVNGRYTHENTIFGQQTGSILYEDYINQVAGPLYTLLVGYDNEMSFSFKMQELINQLLRLRARQKDSVILARLAPLANTKDNSASSAVAALPETQMLNLVDQARNGSAEEQKTSFAKIDQLAKEQGIYPASMFDVYKKIASGEIKGVTVPAINIRTDSLEQMRIIFREAIAKNIGLVILELALSEKGYTAQSPEVYKATAYIAAMLEGYKGPVYLQADHYQTKVDTYANSPEKARYDQLKAVEEAIDADHFGIDLDTSTLVAISQDFEDLEGASEDAGLQPSSVKDKNIRRLATNGYASWTTNLGDKTMQAIQEKVKNTLLSYNQKGYYAEIISEIESKIFAATSEIKQDAKKITDLKDLLKRMQDFKQQIDDSAKIDSLAKELVIEQMLNAQESMVGTILARGLEPKDTSITLGGEIGEVGGKNSEPGEFVAYLELYKAMLNHAVDSIKRNDLEQLYRAIGHLGAGIWSSDVLQNIKNKNSVSGLSKVAIQTGTAHGVGGDIDFRAMRTLAELGQREYGVIVVQHGASNVDVEKYGDMITNGAGEVHLATAYMGIAIKALRNQPQGTEARAIYEDLLDLSLARKYGKSMTQDEIKAKRAELEEQLLKKVADFRNDLKAVQTRIDRLPQNVHQKMGAEFQAVISKTFDKLAVADTQKYVVTQTASSAITDNNKKGGIDFRATAMPITYQPMGNFASLNPRLPVLSNAELTVFDIDQELSGIEKLVDSQMVPSGDRVKEVLAACSQKGELDANKDRLMALLVKMGILEETQCCQQEASREYKEALVLVDSLT